MFELHGAFQQIAFILFAAAAVGGLARRLGQPLIVAFIVVGIAVGPTGLGAISAGEELEVLAEVGIALLLFVVGLKLDLGLIRTVGPVALAAGLGQVGFTSVVGFALALLLGFAPVTALFIAVALTFSSTIIIVKLLSDKQEVDEPHGRVAMGILIVQDLVVVVVMILLTAFGEGSTDDNLALELGLVLLKGAGFVAVIVALMRFVLPSLLDRLARTPELLVLFAISWAVGLAALSEGLEFSAEVGAFLAGVSLASTRYRDAIGARLVSIRDFLLLFFFIDLGTRLDFSQMASWSAAVVLSLFVLIGNPIIVMAIMGFMRYRRRVSFHTGLTVAQISEFSLIFAALGLSLGHIDEGTVGLITTVGLVTIVLSTYLILNSDRIFERLAPLLGAFERAESKEATFDQGDDLHAPEIVLFGMGRYGRRIAEGLEEAGVPTLALDFDPDALGSWGGEHVRVAYGDAEDQELPGTLPLGDARWVISTTGRVETNAALVSALRHHGYEGRVAVTAHRPREAQALRATGVDIVLAPFSDAADALMARIHVDRRDHADDRDDARDGDDGTRT